MTDATSTARISPAAEAFFFQESGFCPSEARLIPFSRHANALLHHRERRPLARDDEHRAEWEAQVQGQKVAVGVAQGLGERIPARCAKPRWADSRSLLRITLPLEFEQRHAVSELVDQLMGRNPEHRFNFIQNRAGEVDRELIDA